MCMSAHSTHAPPHPGAPLRRPAHGGASPTPPPAAAWAIHRLGRTPWVYISQGPPGGAANVWLGLLRGWQRNSRTTGTSKYRDAASPAPKAELATSSVSTPPPSLLMGPPNYGPAAPGRETVPGEGVACPRAETQTLLCHPIIPAPPTPLRPPPPTPWLSGGSAVTSQTPTLGDE